MNREIKFRIWKGKEMDYVTIEQLIYEDGYYYNWGGINQGFIVQQFTGLLDSKGIEIYEGDILEFRNDFEDDEPIVRLPVEFKYGSFVLQGDDNLWIIGQATLGEEVVGNIYDNPELYR